MKFQCMFYMKNEDMERAEIDLTIESIPNIGEILYLADYGIGEDYSFITVEVIEVKKFVHKDSLTFGIECKLLDKETA